MDARGPSHAGQGPTHVRSMCKSVLRSSIMKLSWLAYAIDDERKLQGADVDTLEEYMEKAKMMLGKATRRLNVVYKQSKSNLMLYVVLFAIGLFTVVYVLKKLYRLGRWIV
eukprot:GHUV01016712.1.p1 GENE.GHUV01016712.1~~GHUV01016712.1.p1  ORF type:complete len:111 (+),score=17.14 GHUV01016712.1:346-678(+)